MKRRVQTEAEIAAEARADLSQADYVMGLVSVVTGVPLSDIRALDRKMRVHRVPGIFACI